VSKYVFCHNVFKGEFLHIRLGDGRTPRGGDTSLLGLMWLDAWVRGA